MEEGLWMFNKTNAALQPAPDALQTQWIPPGSCFNLRPNLMSADSLLLLPLNMFSISRDRQSLRCKLFQSVFLPCLVWPHFYPWEQKTLIRTRGQDEVLCVVAGIRELCFSPQDYVKSIQIFKDKHFFCASELPCRQILAWISFHYFSWFHSWCFPPSSPPSSLVNLYRLYSSPSKDIKEETKCWLPSVPCILLDLRNIQRCYTSNGNFCKSWL